MTGRLTRRGLMLGLMLGLLPGLIATVAATGLVLRTTRADRGTPTAPGPARAKPAMAPAEPPDRRLPDPECYLGLAVADLQVDVTSRVEGRVREVAVAVGDSVAAGQRLLTLDSELIRHELTSAEAAHAAALADERDAVLRVDLARATYRRRQALSDILSREQIDESGYELESAKLRLQAAQARTRQAQARIGELRETAARARIVAPFAGTVSAVSVEPGTVVGGGTVVVRLIGSRRRIRFALPPRAAESTPAGATVVVWADDGARRETATVTSLAPEIDPESRMVFAEAALDPAGGDGALPVGTVVRVAPAGRQAPCARPEP